MFHKYLFSIFLFFFFIAPVSAQDYVVDVHGIVCELCSLGVAKKVRKLDFIDPSRLDEGVRVDIEKQRVYLAVRAEAELDREALFAAIESGGYQPVEVWALSASGERTRIEP